MANKKYKLIGFEIDAVLVGKVGKKTIKQPFPIKINSLDEHEIQNVVDYWRNHLFRTKDNRKLIVKGVYKITKVSDGFYHN